ncbi:MAG: hypothetical protein ACR2RE_01535 [Geminicoccaceae bacterium]
MLPFGSFCLDPSPKVRGAYYFFGAGSGITPLFSMIRSMLCAEPHSVAYLLYGNMNTQSIIFRQALEELQTELEGSLRVCHVLSSPSMWSSFDYWRRAKIDAVAVDAFIK